MLNLPWPPAVLVVVLILIYAAQATILDGPNFLYKYSFIPAALTQGDWYGLVTALFIHGGWGHVLINSAFCVAFGAPVARRFGLGPTGGALFLFFFLVCGVCGNLGYALIHPHGGVPVVGASGAIAGLYAAMSRMLSGPRLAPLTDKTAVTMGAAWITLNLIIAFLGIDAGLGAAGAPVAWEAHIAGYIAGIVLIGLFDKAAPGGRGVRR